MFDSTDNQSAGQMRWMNERLWMWQSGVWKVEEESATEWGFLCAEVRRGFLCWLCSWRCMFLAARLCSQELSTREREWRDRECGIWERSFSQTEPIVLKVSRSNVETKNVPFQCKIEQHVRCGFVTNNLVRLAVWIVLHFLLPCQDPKGTLWRLNKLCGVVSWWQPPCFVVCNKSALWLTHSNAGKPLIGKDLFQSWLFFGECLMRRCPNKKGSSLPLIQEREDRGWPTKCGIKCTLSWTNVVASCCLLNDSYQSSQVNSTVVIWVLTWDQTCVQLCKYLPPKLFSVQLSEQNVPFGSQTQHCTTHDNSERVWRSASAKLLPPQI